MRRLMTVMIIGLAMAFGPVADVPASDRLDLSTYLHRVRSHYPQLRRQLAEVEAAKARAAEARAGFWPRVAGNAAVRQSDDQVFAFGALLQQQRFTAADFDVARLNHPSAQTDYTAGVQLELPLFNAFQTIAAVKAASRGTASAHQQEAFLRSEALLVAIEAYLRLLMADRISEAAMAAEESARRDLEQAEALNSQGLILGADFYAARVASSQLRQSREHANASVQIAGVLLNLLMGEPPELRSELSGELPDAPQVAGPLAEWLDAAELRRPDLAAAGAAVEAQRAELFGRRASALPRVSAVGRLDEHSHDLSTGSGSYFVGVMGSMDLLDPGYLSRVRQARAALDRLEAERAVLADRIRSDVAEAWAGYEAAAANLDAARNAAADAEEAMRLTEQLYGEGRKSIADLLQMRLLWLQTRSAYHTLQAAAETGYANLLFVSGGLDAEPAQAIARRVSPGP